MPAFFAFQWKAAKLFESVVDIHDKTDADQLRDLLEARLCNLAQLHHSKHMFFRLKWNKRRKSVDAFDERERSVSMDLQTPVSDKILLSRFKATLPSGLRNRAYIVRRELDTAVSVVPSLSSAQQTGFREWAREVQEISTDSSATYSAKGEQTNELFLFLLKVGSYGFSLPKKSDILRAAKEGEFKGGRKGPSPELSHGSVLLGSNHENF